MFIKVETTTGRIHRSLSEPGVLHADFSGTVADLQTQLGNSVTMNLATETGYVLFPVGAIASIDVVREEGDEGWMAAHG